MAMALPERFRKVDNYSKYDQFMDLAEFDVEIDKFDREIFVRKEDENIRNWGFISDVLKTFTLMNNSSPLKTVLEYVLNAAISAIKADRGAVLLVNSKGEMEFEFARDRAKKTISDKDFKLCHSILHQAVRTKKIAYVDNALLERTFLPSHSMRQLNLSSVLCCPMFADEELIGVIYADNFRTVSGYSLKKLQIFQLYANQAAMAIRNARLHQVAKKSFDQLEKTRQGLIHSQKMATRGKMAAKIGHELNNLLTSVNGHLFLSMNCLENNFNVNKVLNHLEQIKKSIAGMERFSNGLMADSQIQTKFEQCNLNALIHKFLEFCEPIFKHGEASIKVDLDPHLPDIEIDKGQIQQVLYNLIANSIDAKADTDLVLKTCYRSDEGRTIIQVADTGPGISKEKLKKIFTPLFTDKAEGHGFGLSICKDIIDKHGGSISVISEIGRGTEFTISLPLVAKK